jgi:DMSO/TMAO reductase YedYZ molybdopterin-dependent catalytic subunit
MCHFLMTVMRNKTIPIIVLFVLFASLLVLPQLSLAGTGGDLLITDINGKSTTLTYDDIFQLPKTTVIADLFCEGSFVTGGEWSGVKLSDLLSKAGINSVDGSAQLVAEDGYTVSVPSDMAIRPDVIVAYEKNGALLPESLRLVVPDSNGAIWIAQIVSISVGSTYSTQNRADAIGEMAKPLQALASSSDEPSPTMQPQAPSQTEASGNTDVAEPSAPPVNFTQPENKAPAQQGSDSQISPFHLELGYVILFAAIVAVFGVSFVVYRRRRA